MSKAAPQVSIIVPAYNEGDDILPGLGDIVDAVTSRCEVLVVVDTPNDTTIPPVNLYAKEHRQVSIWVNTYGRGPAQAIRFGIDQAKAPTIVVTMADGCDDAGQIDELAGLVEGGAVLAAASRYSKGGRQIGGPRLKGFLSRLAGLTLFWLARVGTRDATNSYKAYDARFLKAVGIESRHGFEIGIELTAKARRYRLPVAEIPTVWTDRALGQSNFKTRQWIPKYLRWYLHAFGPKKNASWIQRRESGDGTKGDRT